MNVICPKCGSEDTVPFSDVQLNQHGFECHHCHKDFGVDDGKNIKEWEDDLIEFTYEKTEKDQTKKTILIQVQEGKVTLTPSILYPNKMLQPIESQDMTPLWEYLKNLFFEKLYILDWNRINVGFVTGQDEKFSLTMKFSQKPTLTYSGSNKFPPYLKVLDELFAGFFDLEQTA